MILSFIHLFHHHFSVVSFSLVHPASAPPVALAFQVPATGCVGRHSTTFPKHVREPFGFITCDTQIKSMSDKARVQSRRGCEITGHLEQDVGGVVEQHD